MLSSEVEELLLWWTTGRDRPCRVGIERFDDDVCGRMSAAGALAEASSGCTSWMGVGSGRVGFDIARPPVNYRCSCILIGSSSKDVYLPFATGLVDKVAALCE